MSKKPYEARIRVFCPTHQTVFETDLKSQLVCDIGGHELSKQFPSAEYWEYCCDCDTYYRSEMQSGGKDNPGCPVCEREPKLRFLCGECKTVASDSGEPARAKKFQIASASSSVSPHCPGCGIGVKGDFTPHACQVMLTPLSSTRANCPFCGMAFKSVIHNADGSREGSESSDSDFGFENGLVCQQCGAANSFDSAFCVTCGSMLEAVGTRTMVSSAADVPSSMANLSGSTASASTGAVPKGRRLPSARKKTSPWLTIALPSVAAVLVLTIIISQLVKKSASTTADNKPVQAQALALDAGKKSFTGTMNGKPIEFTLSKDGNAVKGEVKITEDSGQITDKVEGALTATGFEVRGYQGEASYALGTYKATYDKTGKIVGFWESNFGKKLYFEATETFK